MQEITTVLRSSMPCIVHVKYQSVNGAYSKTVSLNDYTRLLNNLNAKEEGVRIGKLPRGFIDGKLVLSENIKETSGTVAIYVSGGVYPTVYDGKKNMLPYPANVFVFTIHQGILSESRVYSTTCTTKYEILDETILYNFPYGNVDPYVGRICWGRNGGISQLNSLMDLNGIITLFYSAEMNHDLYRNGISCAYKENLTAFINTMINEKEFPATLLISNRKFIDIFKGE